MKKLHIGIILDGNRRFAKRLMTKPWKGHEYGAQKVRELFEWCEKFNVNEITLYCLSLENFKRPKREFDFLMKLFKKEFEELENDPKIEENKIRMKFIGKKELFNPEIQALIRKLEEKTKKNNRFIINFALAYGGRQEILDVVKKIVHDIKNVEKITEKTFEKYLWLNSEPDFIIRTGGEKRTSNFLPWQSTYSEWIFLDKMWPEFTENDLKNSIREFHDRQRRFGK